MYQSLVNAPPKLIRTLLCPNDLFAYLRGNSFCVLSPSPILLQSILIWVRLNHSVHPSSNPDNDATPLNQSPRLLFPPPREVRLTKSKLLDEAPQNSSSRLLGIHTVTISH